MRIKQHKESGLWIREDGAVCMPPDGHRFFKFRWTFGSKNKGGYMSVTFRGKMYLIHRLVAQTYLDNPEGYKEVDHYPDRNRSNNAVNNLRWADRKMQCNNTWRVDDSVSKYGVRSVEDHAGYMRAYRAKNPEYAERERANGRVCKRALYENNPEKYRAYKRALYENNPEYALKQRANRREWEAKQRALGRRRRKCPDGKQHWLTDEEFNKRYKDSLI